MLRRVIILTGCGAAVILMAACIFPFFPTSSTPTTGTLSVDIDYTGTWYRDTFNYARDAPNIKHYVLVVPESEADRASAGEIFVNYSFWSGPDEPLVNRDGEDLSWALDYLHEAPEGYFTGDFAPGRYMLAAAFIAAPLSREEAGVSGDVILYPGVTGGGASTDYKGIVIEAGKTADIKIILTDANGWACPWLYIYDGRDFERRTEVLRNLRGPGSERTEITRLGTVPVIDGAIIVRISEEKPEIAFIDALYLIVDGKRVPAEAAPGVTTRVAAQDHDYLILTAGESYEFRFAVPDAAQVSIGVTGFYVPLD
jgi:hypothetical protein